MARCALATAARPERASKSGCAGHPLSAVPPPGPSIAPHPTSWPLLSFPPRLRAWAGDTCLSSPVFLGRSHSPAETPRRREEGGRVGCTRGLDLDPRVPALTQGSPHTVPCGSLRGTRGTASRRAAVSPWLGFACICFPAERWYVSDVDGLPMLSYAQGDAAW